MVRKRRILYSLRITTKTCNNKKYFPTKRISIKDEQSIFISLEKLELEL